MKTKIWLKRLATVAVAMQAGVTWAGESPWALRLGVSYRDFDDIEFEGGGFRNLGTAANPTGPYGVQNVTTVVGNPLNAPVILDYVSASASSNGLDSSDKWGPIIGFGYDLTPQCKRGLGLVLVGNFQYYHLDVDSNASGTVGAPGGATVRQYQHWWVDTSVPADFIPDRLTPGVLLVGPALPGTTFAFRNEFEMDLYVLDLGLQARATVDPVSFTLALGPSLTIADAESSQHQQASWLAQGPGLPAGGYARKTSESELDFLWGVYAALGVTVDISDSWSLGLEYRYDYVSEDAGTDQAKLDLSGSSGILRLAYRF
jgi:opacity protein-like surface antigen